MDTSQNRDIGRRQALLGVAGKNVIPPQRIIQQQRRLSATESAHKLIPREHKELCPLCLFPSFIFDQRHKSLVHTGPTSPRLPGTFLCALCCNKNIQSKLCDIKILKQEIRAQSRLITPILKHKVNAPNTRYRDKRLRVKHSQRRISALKRLIEQRHKENQHCMWWADGFFFFLFILSVMHSLSLIDCVYSFYFSLILNDRNKIK